MNVFLLCAGEGTRFRPYTTIKPKPAIPFLGVPMAAYSLFWAEELDTTLTVVNTFHLSSQIRDLITSIPVGEAPVQFSDERPELKGAAGGLKFAQPFFDSDTILIMNGDEVFLPHREGQLAKAYEYHKKGGHWMTIVGMKYPGVGSKFGGVWTRGDREVLGFGKQPPNGADFGWHFIGPIFVSREIFDLIPAGAPANIFYDTAIAGIAQGKPVRIFEVEGWWNETGNVADYLQGTREAMGIAHNESTYAASYFRELCMRFHPKMQLRGKSILVCDETPNLDVDAVEGFAVLGRGVHLKPGVRLHDVVLGDGASVTESLAQQFVLK